MDGPNTKYKSIEQRVWDFLEPTIKMSYGAAVSPFRMPTLIRKIAEGTSPCSNLKSQGDLNYNSLRDNLFPGIGTVTSLIVEGTTMGRYILNETSNGNYLPLAVILGTNALSGAFEAGRYAWKKEHECNKGYNNTK